MSPDMRKKFKKLKAVLGRKDAKDQLKREGAQEETEDDGIEVIEDEGEEEEDLEEIQEELKEDEEIQEEPEETEEVEEEVKEDESKEEAGVEDEEGSITPKELAEIYDYSPATVRKN